MPNSYICTLDIGCSKISACVAEARKRRIQKVFSVSLPVKGLKNGLIVDSISLVNSVTTLLKELKKKSGINIKFIYANISGKDIITKHSRAIVPLAERGNKVITVSDIQRVNEQARILGSSLEEEIIHFIPLNYSIDSKSGVANPLGLYSHRLEVDLYLVCAKLNSIQSLNRLINQAGFEIKDLFFSGLASAKAVFNEELKDGCNVFCDIGSDITELLLFKDGCLKDIEIILLGGDELTSELQEQLKVPFELAEDIKRSYGIIGDHQHIGEDKEILIKKSAFYRPIKQKLVTEILSSKARVIASCLKESLEKRVSGYEVNNFFICGRSVLLEGFIEMLENVLEIPVKLARVNNPAISAALKEGGELSGQKYLTYLTALGMICEALQNKTYSHIPFYQPPKNPLARLFNRFNEVYQEYF
ncbi:MAG: cell division protein FtsA [Candidatus Omnitrophota bacterium]|nr:cell division protein FtsA [Candidatus Omnitrophota bacterium]